MLKHLFFATLVVSGSFASELSHPVAHVNNFAMVTDHLWRGAEPTDVGLSELGSAGVKVLIDLRESGTGTEFEKGVAEKLGIHYVNVPFQPMSAPSSAQIQTVLKMLAENQDKTVFLHCRRGKDRTGTVVACYRIQHDGWDNEHALSEAKHFGMSPLEVGMRSFILHFAPTLSAAKPAIF